MYRLYKLIKWWVMFKKEIADFQLAADFHKEFQTDEKERDKAVGQSLMAKEQSQDKLKVTKKLLKMWLKS